MKRSTTNSVIAVRWKDLRPVLQNAPVRKWILLLDAKAFWRQAAVKANARIQSMAEDDKLNDTEWQQSDEESDNEYKSLMAKNIWSLVERQSIMIPT